MAARYFGNGIWSRAVPFERIAAMADELNVPVLVLATLLYLPPPGETRAEHPTMTNAALEEWMDVLRMNLAYCYRIREEEASPPALIRTPPPTLVEPTDGRGRVPRSPETRAKMADAKRAWWTPERRAAWSDEMKRRAAVSREGAADGEAGE